MRVHPVFVVGSVRSGTSILSDGIRAVGYRGFNEGNFLPILRALELVVERHFKVFWTEQPRVMISHIDKDALKTQLFRAVANMVSELHQDGPWMDKSGNPEMIEAIPILLGLWPSSRFIFAKRRAIENIISRQVKFPRHEFKYHCSDWARNMAAWRMARVRLPDLRAIEVDQREVSAMPRTAAARISSFLELNPEDEAIMAQKFEKEHPEQTGAGTADRVTALTATGWTAEQQQLFHLHCDEEMQAYGYTTDERYAIDMKSSGG